jgi:hypothetical protein
LTAGREVMHLLNIPGPEKEEPPLPKNFLPEFLVLKIALRHEIREEL